MYTVYASVIYYPENKKGTRKHFLHPQLWVLAISYKNLFKLEHVRVGNM